MIVLAPLKPSLVEWKPQPAPAAVRVVSSLKPSLVEWKRSSVVAFQSPSGSLETFLGGMETPFPSPRI